MLKFNIKFNFIAFSKMKIIALIVSGGEGKRFDKNLPKQFFSINGKSILEISVRNFFNSNLFDKIIVVSNKNF